MKKVIIICIFAVFSSTYSFGSEKPSIPESAESVHFTLSSSDIIPQNRELVRTIAKAAKEEETISIADNSRLKSAIEILIQDKLKGLSAAERQKLVKDTIGEETYSIFEQVYSKMLASNEIVQQRSAITMTGFPLFNLAISDKIKKYILSDNRQIQLEALETLVYLDDPGANHLLISVVLSGSLPDYLASSAIKALYITGNKDLEEFAPVVLVRNTGGGAFKTLLPVLKKREDFNEIAAVLFKKNLFSIPDKKELNIEELAKTNSEHALLEEIFENPSPFMSDEDIKKKVVMYANTQYGNLSTISLVILEKAGQELEYFTEMIKDSNISENKKRTLEYIISRIQKGERLK